MTKLEPKKTELKIMCATHTACPKVLIALRELNFQNIKETPSDPTSDISAMYVIDDEKKIQEKASTLLEICRKDIQQITIR